MVLAWAVRKLHRAMHREKASLAFVRCCAASGSRKDRWPWIGRIERALLIFPTLEVTADPNGLIVE